MPRNSDHIKWKNNYDNRFQVLKKILWRKDRREIWEFLFSSSCNSNLCSLVSASVWFYPMIELFWELSYLWTFARTVSSACDAQFACLSGKVQLAFKAQFNHHLPYEAFTEPFSHLLPSHISPSTIIMLCHHPSSLNYYRERPF